MARLQEDVRRLRFWRGIIAELLGSLFVVFLGCAAFTITFDEHSLAVKVSAIFRSAILFRGAVSLHT